MNLQELLSLAVERGVKFLLEGDTLAYRAPKDAMSPELREAVGTFKTELVEILRRSRMASSVAPISRSASLELSPTVLSSGQERLWLIQRVIGDSPLYNVHIRLRSSGAFDRATLERSVQALVARNAILRTTFREFDGEPRAVVSAEGGLSVSYFDLRDRVADVRSLAAERIAREQRCEPFDLTRGPLTRLALITLAEDDQVLLVTQHHIITDAWSLGLLLGELNQHYRALLAGEPLPEPEPLRYSDYAIWQNQRTQRDSHKHALEWWKQRLAGLPRLELPYLASGVGPANFAGEAYAFSIPKALTAGLKQLAAQRRCTLYVILLTGWAVLLHRYSGQNDFAIGTVSSGRERPELRNLLGFFVNTLALRVDLASDTTIRDAIDQVRSTLDAALEHEVPFGDVVNALGASRGPSLNPLIQASIVFENAPVRAHAPGEQGFRVSFEKLNAGVEGTAKFDLNLVLKEDGDALAGCLEYATALFEAATVERIIGHFHAVLEGMVRRPGAGLCELSLLSDVECEQLSMEASIQASAEGCVHELFAAQAARTPHATAVVAADGAISFADLEIRTNRLANYLRARGVGPDVRVGLCLTERSVDLAVGMLAILKAGGAYVPLEPKQPRKRLESLLLDAEVKVVVGDTEVEAALSPSPFEFVRLDADSDRIAAEPDAAPSTGVGPGHLAYVIFTSGSTGRPKPVAVEHRQVANYARAIWGRMGLAAGCQFAHVSTFAADLGHTVLFPPLCFGGTLHLLARSLTVDPQSLAAYFEERHIDCLKIVPSHLVALLSGAEPARVLPRQLLILGGEASSWDLIDRIRGLSPGLRVMNHYGPTETTVGVLTFDVPFGRRPGTANVPLGRPLANTRVHVVDGSLQPLPKGIRGELVVTGAQVARGYLGEPEANSPRFVFAPWGNRERAYRSGDFVRQIDTGEIEFLGRVDQQLKIRGFRVELGEIEATLSQHPRVRSCLVLARESASVGVGTRLVAYAVTDGPAVTVEELRLHLKERLPDYMIPSWIIALETMPLGPNGKVDRSKLPAPSEIIEHAEGRAPSTDTEKAVARIWREVLGVEALDIDQSFFALGGHSLLVLKVHARFQQSFSNPPSIGTLFARPTIAALASWIDESSSSTSAAARSATSTEPNAPDERRTPATESGDGPALVELKRGNSTRPPLFLVHQAGGVVNSYYLLAARLPAEQPVYAIRAGLSMDRSLERLAARYIELARARWTNGPCRLGGASFGGLVAYEMAQQLRHQHETLGTLLMLDTEEPGQMSEAPRSNEEILKFLRHAAPDLVDLLLSPGATERDLLPDAGAFLDNFRECVNLRCSYRPRPFAGDVVYFRATDRGASASRVPDEAWRPLVSGRLQVIEAPGNHMAMLQNPHVDSVAEHISSVLDADLCATL